VIQARPHPLSTRRPAAIRVLVAAATLLGAAVAQAPVDSFVPGASWTVVAIGDSFMAGVGVVRRSDAMPFVYGRLLAEGVGASVEVLNHGTGELTTVADWAVKVTESASLADDLGSADVVLVWLGYHDVLGPLWSAAWPDPLRAQLEDVVERSPANWDAFFSALAAAVPPHARILVGELGIPPYLFDRYGSDPDWDEIRRLAYLDWRAVMVETADRYGARVVPTFAAFNGPDGDALVSPGSAWPDGLHVDEVVHRFVAELFCQHDGIDRGD
jgi:lysophospholipase L1-like esterase